MSRVNVEGDLMKQQIIIKNELNNDIMVNRFILNEVSYFGPGARKELPTVVANRGWKKALVVTDKGLMKFGVAKMVLDVLDEANIAYEVLMMSSQIQLLQM